MSEVSCVRGAVIDETGRYRYSLYRKWDEGPWVTWIMLNPSTADADRDDPTIRRCIAFSKAWGYAGLQVVNLFAYRATNPKELKNADDPIGPDHAAHFLKGLEFGSLIVAAWGSHKSVSIKHIADLLAERQIWCLGKNADGQPKHPLYVSGSTNLVMWNEGKVQP